MRLLERRVTRLSLAVRLADEFAPGRRVVGDVTVTVADRPWRARRNPSGDFLFLELPPGPATIRVTAAFYLEETRTVALPLAALAPVVAVTLKPAWFYPFPTGATLVQGLVRDPAEQPVTGVAVTLVERNLATRSGADGRFVIALNGLVEDDISVAGDRRLVKPGPSGTTFHLRLEHPGFQTGTVGIGEVEEGRRTVVAPAVTLARR